MTPLPKPFWAELRELEKLIRGDNCNHRTVESEFSFLRRLAMGNTTIDVGGCYEALTPEAFARGIVERHQLVEGGLMWTERGALNVNDCVTYAIEKWIASSRYHQDGMPIFEKEVV